MDELRLLLRSTDNEEGSKAGLQPASLTSAKEIGDEESENRG